MKSVQTPEVQTHATPDQLVVAPSAHVSHGGGSSKPGVCESPADAGMVNMNATASTRGSKSFLTVVSPIEVVDLGGFAASVSHDTAQTDPAVSLFRAYAEAEEFDRLERFCLERGAFARDHDSRLRWLKDFGIALGLQGRHVEALEALRGAEWLTVEAGARVLGRYRNECGILWANLGRTSHALEQFGPAYQKARSVGDLWTCASVDHNRARALVTRGETQKAMRYIKRALDYARANNDYRLELEVLESLREFGGLA